MAPSPAGTTSYSVPVRILESGQELSLFEEEVPREGASFSWMLWDLPRPKLRRAGPTRAPPMGERSVTARSEELAEQKRAEDAQMGEPLQLANLAVLAAEERHEQGGEQQAPAPILERQRHALSHEAADQEPGTVSAMVESAEPRTILTARWKSLA